MSEAEPQGCSVRLQVFTLKNHIHEVNLLCVLRNGQCIKYVLRGLSWVDVDSILRVPEYRSPDRRAVPDLVKAFEDSTRSRCVLRRSSMVVLLMSNTKGENYLRSLRQRRQCCSTLMAAR